MTEDQREIRRKKRVLEYAEKVGNINTTCRRFGIARSTFYCPVSEISETRRILRLISRADFVQTNGFASSFHPAT